MRTVRTVLLEVKMMTGNDEVDDVEDFHLHGPSGAMSFILPSVDALLGIRNTSAELREASRRRCFAFKI